jgi:hypothetical protein
MPNGMQGGTQGGTQGGMQGGVRYFDAIDTEPHPAFPVYSAGNFREVAPERLSVMSWSLVGEPMEQGTRNLMRRLWGTTPSWASGGHYVFVGYFACRPYHNLSAFCRVAAHLPLIRARDVTESYFEGIAPPVSEPRRRLGGLRRPAAALRLARELAEVKPRTVALEASLSQLEGDLGAVLSARSAAPVGEAFARARRLLDEAWDLHMTTTSTLVPLRAAQRKVNRRLLDAADELQPWLARPAELVWGRLHYSANVEGPGSPGHFLHSAFYEVADEVAPWDRYATRHLPAGQGTRAGANVADPVEVLYAMLPRHRRLPVQALANAVGDTMAAREASKSLPASRPRTGRT